MMSSGGSSPLPPSPSPLPPSPYQQTYNPQTGITFAAPAAGTPSAPASPPKRKVGPQIAGVLVIFAVVFVVLLATGALDGLFGSSGSTNPNVQVTQTSASHVCPAYGSPTETFLFTLVNGGSTNANAAIGFYLNDAQVQTGTYFAAAGTSTPYSVSATLASCPPSGTTYYLDLISVTAV